MAIFLIIVGLYLILGISRIVSDLNQPKFFQPQYIQRFSLSGILFAIILSPLFWLERIKRPVPEEQRSRIKEIKKLEREVDKLRKDMFGQS